MTTPGQQPPQGPQQPPQPPPPGAWNSNDPVLQQDILSGGGNNIAGGLGGLLNPIAGLVKYTEDYINASGSGKFSIDPAEIQPLIGQWQEAIDQLNVAQQHAQRLTAVEGPGDEDASNNMAQGANKSGAAYIKHNQQLIEYCQREQDKLRTALQLYQQNEEQNAHHVTRHGRS